jgi:hypothetical protein
MNSALAAEGCVLLQTGIFPQPVNPLSCEASSKTELHAAPLRETHTRSFMELSAGNFRIQHFLKLQNFDYARPLSFGYGGRYEGYARLLHAYRTNNMWDMGHLWR